MNRKTKELIYQIRFQCGNGNPIRTCNICSTENCGETVIGTGHCILCLEIKLSEETNKDIAKRFCDGVKQAGIALYEINEFKNTS